MYPLYDSHYCLGVLLVRLEGHIR